MPVYQVKDRMFEQNITLVYNKPLNQFKGYLKRRFGYCLDGDGFDGQCLRLYMSGEPVEYVIWLEKFDCLINQYGLLAHELMHLVYFVMEDTGIRYSEDSVEVFCYYLQSIMSECIYGLTLKPNKNKIQGKTSKSAKRH
jgi:hypothetical protein